MKRVFISYASEDSQFRDAFATHLDILCAARIVKGWHDGKIAPGEDWKTAIDRELDGADIIVLLISANFLASEFHQEFELLPALRRWRAKQAHVVPVIVRACDWEASPIADLRVLPTRGKPVATWTHPDEAWTEVVRAIRVAAQTDSSPLIPRKDLRSQDEVSLRGMLLQMQVSLDACILVGGSLLRRDYPELVAAVNRGVRPRFLFPIPGADWLASMTASLGLDPFDYAQRISSNAARAQHLGPTMELRWHDTPTTVWFAISDGKCVAHKSIDLLSPTFPAVTADSKRVQRFCRIFESLWGEASQSIPSELHYPRAARQFLSELRAGRNSSS